MSKETEAKLAQLNQMREQIIQQLQMRKGVVQQLKDGIAVQEKEINDLNRALDRVDGGIETINSLNSDTISVPNGIEGGLPEHGEKKYAGDN